jgi:riboflavin kinase/FMN adenylyltransferase
VASPQGVYRLGIEMQHFQNIDALQLPASVLTIGSFDGVHLGHQALIQEMIAAAQIASIPAAVLTFYPHPSVVLQGRRPSFYITSPDEKAERLGSLGVDYVITQKFDRSLSLMRASEFLHWVKDRLQFQMLWVGGNFAFGYKREGNIKFLGEISKELDFELHVVPPILVDGEIVSSTRIREALQSGEVSRATRYLGKPFILRGVVEPGSGRGKKLGIPTANLKLWDEMAYPSAGVYACFSKVNGKTYKAVVNIGVRPTFNDDLDAPLIEAHLLNFDGDLYGQDIELSFVQRLRREQRFNDPQDLQAQIQRDIENAKDILIETL